MKDIQQITCKNSTQNKKKILNTICRDISHKYHYFGRTAIYKASKFKR